MSRSLAAKCGSVDSLNWRIRCGCRPWTRQIRCTEETLIPAVLAIMPAVQWVVSPGGSCWVSAITRAATAAPNGGMRERRVLSRRSPSTPACMNRSCQRHTQVLLLPVRRMISTVPSPSAVSSTIRARHTCFCGLFRSATIVSKRARSAALTSTTISLRIPQTRTRREPGESPVGFFRQVLSTSKSETNNVKAAAARSTTQVTNEADVAVPQIKGAAAAVVQMKEEFRQKTEAEASKLPNEIHDATRELSEFNTIVGRYRTPIDSVIAHVDPDRKLTYLEAAATILGNAQNILWAVI